MFEFLFLKAELSADHESLRPLHYGMCVRLPNPEVRSDELEDLLSVVCLYNEVEVVGRSVQVTFDEAKACYSGMFPSSKLLL
jgi:hypothetical protein